MHIITLSTHYSEKREEQKYVNNDAISVCKRKSCCVLCAISECSCQLIEKKAALDGQRVVRHSSWVCRNSSVTAFKVGEEEKRDRKFMFVGQRGHKEI